MKNRKGSILIDAVIGMMLMTLIAALVMNITLVRKNLKYDSRCEEMTELWELEDIETFYAPEDPSLIDELIPRIITEEDLEDSP